MQSTQQRIPSIGLGTFRLKGETVIDSVHHALDLGYRLIDTAQIYHNEADIGEALKTAKTPRSELFLTTKIWTDNLSKDKLIPSLKDSLSKLGTEQVDLTLIHWPSPGDSVPVAEYMGALAEAQAQGLTRLIGISNFTVALMQEAIDAVGADAIATNQVEIHPYLQNRKVVEFARSHGLRLTSFMTLAYGKALQDAVVQDIARNHDATPAQVVLAWALQQGLAVIPSSTRRENLASNLKASELTLTPDDMSRIAALDRGERLANPEGIAPAWD